jgi:hypothetical protein
MSRCVNVQIGDVYNEMRNYKGIKCSLFAHLQIEKFIINQCSITYSTI